jgi:hypothetical protein
MMQQTLNGNSFKVNPKLKHIVFRIRRCYFNKIVDGTKPFELRKNTAFWRKRLLRAPLPFIAVFVCGKDVHRRKAIQVTVGPPEKYLGRLLSEQGKKDIPTELCIATHLAEVV